MKTFQAALVMRLRSRAKWFRMFAKLGDTAKQAEREALAQKFERIADEAEKRLADEQ
jgi:hypothetical protein